MLKIFISFLLLFSMQSLLAQVEEATTTTGKKVILYSDGTWKYKEEGKDVKKESVKVPEKKDTDRKIDDNKIVVATGDCSGKLEEIQDKNNVVTTRTRNFIIVAGEENKQEIYISVQKGAKGIVSISFRTGNGSDCIGEGNKINIVFTDGSKTDLSNDGPLNCRGESIANFNGPYGKKKQFQDLYQKRISSIKIWTQQGTVQQTLTKENQEEFVQVLSCLNSK